MVYKCKDYLNTRPRYGSRIPSLMQRKNLWCFIHKMHLYNSGKPNIFEECETEDTMALVESDLLFSFLTERSEQKSCYVPLLLMRTKHISVNMHS